MPKHLITMAAMAVAAVAVTGCSDHRSSPLTPPSPQTSAPVLGGGQLPDVIDVPTTIPASTTSSTMAG
ncbi:hypothetical protein [Nocardia sp. NPDC004860]|uniref:hypothetical protein n=1 Tax=Nocardia sp. NPDC004860 TaxID=3154557 RepID=UPI0033AC5A06